MIKLCLLVLLFLLPQSYGVMVAITLILDVCNQDFLGTALLCYLMMNFAYTGLNLFFTEIVAYVAILLTYVLSMSLIMKLGYTNPLSTLSISMQTSILIITLALICTFKKRLSF